MAKLCFVTASPMTIKAFLVEHVEALAEHEVVLVADFGSTPSIFEWTRRTPRCIKITIRRKINPPFDLAAFVRLFVLMRRERFDLVYSQTPKAGLLAMLAARSARVPIRIHAFTGQVWATRTGWYRKMLRAFDRVTAACCSQAFVDSPSQRDFLLQERVISARRSNVIANGSVCGVNTSRYRPDPRARRAVRQRFGLPFDAFVFLFVGRLCVEKGIVELVEAFRALRQSHPDAYLMMVGPDEGGLTASIGRMPGLVWVGHTDRPEQYYPAAEVFCLPSHREGFGSVIIEAAACGLPAIGSDIYGISDAIAAGETGLLHTVGDAIDLERSMRALIEDRDLTASMGARALERARSQFSSEMVVDWFATSINRHLASLDYPRH